MENFKLEVVRLQRRFLADLELLKVVHTLEPLRDITFVW